MVLAAFNAVGTNAPNPDNARAGYDDQDIFKSVHGGHPLAHAAAPYLCSSNYLRTTSLKGVSVTCLESIQQW